MIEDKELGVKIAVNEDEAFWEETRKRCTKEIDLNKKGIIINEHLLTLCTEKLEAYKPKDLNT